ncbi:MAG: alkaline phosphatase PhoX [Planctomycetota bacterium]
MKTQLTLTASAILVAAGSLAAQQPSMMRGIGWRTDEIHTIAEPINGYNSVGIPDGMGVFPNPDGPGVILYVNHELNPGNGEPYTLANGTMLTGTRISRFVVDRNADGSANLIDGRLAYDTIVDENGVVVTDPAQINKTGNAIDGMARFCSGGSIQAGTFGFVDDIYACGEETSTSFHPTGGAVFMIDVDTDTLYSVPALGLGAWENVTPVETGDPQTVALLLADDTSGAPLWLWVGVKSGTDFLDRNGLSNGNLYYWKSNGTETSPEDFNTAGTLSGAFELFTGDQFSGTSDDLRGAAQANGAFQFSRPEDVSTNPADGTQVVFASTGRGSSFPSDNWGTTYLVDIDFPVAGAPTADITILADSDGLSVPDEGVRSPDNLVWADNGLIYIQEDRSTSPSSLFGGVTGIDASMWELDPNTQAITRVGEINRSVILPLDASDLAPSTLGLWESSGVIDVTSFFPTAPGETLLIANVQAHGIRDGSIGDNPLRDEGGQIFFMSNAGLDSSVRCQPSVAGANITWDVTNGTPGNGYAIVVAFANAGAAPEGFFFGISPTFPEFAITSGPLLGVLNSNGDASFTIPVAGGICPLGIRLDTVALELGGLGTPVQAGPATTIDI